MSKTILIILIIALSVIILAGMGFLTYIMVQLIKANKAKINDPHIADKQSSVTSPYQTNFFNDSAEHAKKVLFQKEFIHEYGEPQYYGNKLLDMAYKLNDQTKENIIIAIKSTCIESETCRSNERLFRMMAEQEQVPVWFIILREAVKKVVPEFVVSSQNDTDSKIISITSKVA